MKPANRAPVYAACCYPELAELCREKGYALAIHGSLARDFDLVAIPWRDEVSSEAELLEAIQKTFAITKILGPETKEYGRVVYTLCWMGEAFMDFSFFPGR